MERGDLGGGQKSSRRPDLLRSRAAREVRLRPIAATPAFPDG